MESLSGEEFAARLAYLQEQKALAKTAADAAKKEMQLNEDIEQMRRQQKRRAFIDLSAESPPKVKMEALHNPESEMLHSNQGPGTVHNNEEPEEIQFNETPVETPARNGNDPLMASVAAEPIPNTRPQHMILLDSDLPNQHVTQPKKKKRKSSEGSSTPTDHQRFSQIVDDDEFRTITRALEGDDLVELRCNICNGNCGKYSQTLIFFGGVSGFRTHIQVSHPSSLPASGKLTAREVVQRCTYRTLAEDEKQAVRNSDHGACKIGKILAGGADAGAPVHATRAPSGKRSRPTQVEGRMVENEAVRSDSSTTPAMEVETAWSAGGANQDDDDDKAVTLQAPTMGAGGRGRRRKHTKF